MAGPGRGTHRSSLPPPAFRAGVFKRLLCCASTDERPENGTNKDELYFRTKEHESSRCCHRNKLYQQRSDGKARSQNGGAPSFPFPAQMSGSMNLAGIR